MAIIINGSERHPEIEKRLEENAKESSKQTEIIIAFTGIMLVGMFIQIGIDIVPEHKIIAAIATLGLITVFSFLWLRYWKK